MISRSSDSFSMKPSIMPPRDTRNGDPQHWVGGNFRRGLPMRPKRAFETETEAQEFAQKVTFVAAVYRCKTCNKWHLSNTKKRS